MFYLIGIIRNESLEITDRVILSKSEKNQVVSKQEHAVIFDEVDHDIETSKVSVGEGGVLFIEPDADKITEIAKAEDRALRKKRREFGGDLIDLMGQRNDEKDLTVEQLMSLVSSFAGINTAWLNGMIASSRDLIEAITPDGTLITQGDKDAILAAIDAKWLELGYEPQE